MAEIILASDIGSSSLKAAFIDFSGRLLALSRIPYTASQHCTAGHSIPDARSWELAFAKALEKLHAISPDSVPDCVCLSGNGPTLVPVTKDGEALPPLYWQGSKIERASRSFFLPHAAWFKENNPEEYERAEYFLSSHEWLAHALGADVFTALPSAAYEPYYWDDDQFRLFGLDKMKFPAFIKMGGTAGQVSGKAASSFGAAAYLKGGTPIIAGGPDFISAIIGTGALKSGDVCDRAGSSEGINVCVEAPPSGMEGLRLLPHAKEGLWNISALIPSSGRLLEKYRRDSGQESRTYDDLLTELSYSLFPTPHSPFPIPNSSSLIPNSSFTKGQAVLCTMGFAVRRAIDTLGQAGIAVKTMRVSGGQARNTRWNQLKADITGVTLLVPEIPDGELAGNAVIAASALKGESLEKAADRMIRIKDVYTPQNTEYWDEQFIKYLKGKIKPRRDTEDY